MNKLGVGREVVNEAKQNVRERLFVGNGSMPRIVEYDGRGELRNWVRVILIREALYLGKRTSKEVPICESVAFISSADDDPEASYFKAHYGSEYEDAIAVAALELTAQQRTILRQHYVYGMSIDELGAAHGVHRTTAARRVENARAELLSNVRTRLSIRLGLPHAEVSEIVHLVGDHVDVSMARLFAEPDDATTIPFPLHRTRGRRAHPRQVGGRNKIAL